MKRYHPTSLLALGLMLWLLAACSPSRYLAEGERILRDNRYEVTMDDGSPAPKEITEALSGMRSYAAQKPNPRVAGVRWSLRIYSLANPSDTGIIANYLHRQGAAPVVYNHSATYRTAEQLQRLLESKGCFASTVTFDTTHFRRFDINVVYHLQASPRYRIARLDYHCNTPEIDRLLEQWKKDSPLRAGDFYDADIVSAERNRIVSLMRDSGYFYAAKENIIFFLDTANDDTTLNLALRVEEPRLRTASGELVPTPYRRHRIDRVLFYPSASPAGRDTLSLDYTTAFFGRQRKTRFLFIDPDAFALGPQVIARNMFLFQGQPYRDRNVERTYNSLLSMRNFKYVNIEFTPSPHYGSAPDSALLDAHIRLIPAKRQRVALSFEINNSSAMADIASSRGNFGVEGTLTYQNKTLFRRHGGLLTVDLSTLVELPKDFHVSDDGKRWAAFEVGASTTLDLPTLLLPFSSSLFWQRTRPHTLISLGANYQDRPYLQRVVANVSYGFSWTHNRRVSHQFFPIELTYAHYPFLADDFLHRVTSGSANSRLVYQYSDHLILDARYTYTYSNQTYGSRNDFTYFTFSAESAGNLLYALDALIGFPHDEQGEVSTLFGVPYSQHVRLSAELKHYLYHGRKATFVSRLLLGAGLPYGNSRGMQMPYEKSFFGGGPNTMRAWHLRQLGPGNNPVRDTLFERTGDMTLLLNLEERFPIFGPLEGALFVDMGNVWLIYPTDDQPGAHFSPRSFLPSLAVGTGVGLRLNVSILTLRLDVGLPVFDPGYPQGARFRIPHWHEYSRSFKDFSLGPATLNLGIDYPF